MDIPHFRKESIPYEFGCLMRTHVLHDEWVDYMREISRMSKNEINLSELVLPQKAVRNSCFSEREGF